MTMENKEPKKEIVDTEATRFVVKIDDEKIENKETEEPASCQTFT